MCGIFIYRGRQTDAVERVITGLQRLEYRGYDSWGVAAVAIDQPRLWVHKQVGKISQARHDADAPLATVAMAHTRWATHGGITQANAHPHLASDGSFALVQNGIVQNFQALKATLLNQGYRFQSETDTEVIVHQIEAEVAALASDQPITTDQLLQAVRAAAKKLEGRNTFVVLTKSGDIIAARQGSPLVIGQGQQAGEWWLSSDTLSFADQVKQIGVVENGQMVQITDQGLSLFDAATGQQLPVTFERLNLTKQTIDKEGYDHYMLKEIHESPVVIEQVCLQPKQPLQDLAARLKSARTVYTIGSGTAGVAAAQLAYYLRAHGGIAATSLVGADAFEYLPLFGPEDVVIAPSQSGETADVLEILEAAKAKGVTIATYVNMQGASMTRLADYPFLAQAGPEICVMSTKVLISQLAWGYLLAKTVQGQYESGVQILRQTAAAIEQYLNDAQAERALKKVVQFLLPSDDIFLLAKAQLYQPIREGMVKLIEGSYKHAHALPAGDLKHYAITLMEKGVPVIVVMANDQVRSDVMNAAFEVQARGASVVGIGSEVEASFGHFLTIPDTGEGMSISSVVPLQLLAYHLAVELGHDVDHPRNIAKSVTVK